MQDKDRELQAALTAHMNGQYSEAEKYYISVIETNKQSVTALTNFGILLAQTNRLEEGLRTFPGGTETRTQ